MKIPRSTVISTIITIISVSSPAFSQENTDNDELTHKRSLSVGIGFPDYSQSFQAKTGVGIGPVPEYEGSDDYAATGLPLIEIRKPGVFFVKGASINTNDGLASAGLTLLHFSYSEESRHRVQLVMGPLVRAYRGRDESDNDILNGLGDIDQSVGVGGFIALSTGAWLVNLSVSPQDVGNDTDGTLATFDIGYTVSIKNRLQLTTGLSTSWADDDYIQGYFGVSDAQAIRSGLSRFDITSGFKDTGIQMKASYAISPRWSLEGQIGYWRLLNDAADSPIVKDAGSADQVRGLIGLSYQF
ncbi:MAG: MipA/OmpV family protein [Gammaproteobacteria bacterium]|nr:MipA/OmpV family protein [Gammaproteobacteria bacterium]